MDIYKGNKKFFVPKEFPFFLLNSQANKLTLWMKKYDLILGIILLAGMVTLISGVEQLRHAVKIAIQKEAEEVERIITEATDKLTMSSLKKENIASYNMDDSEFFFVIDGEEIKKKVSADVSTHWVTTAPFYDVRDTSKWTLGALDGKIRGLAGEQAWKGMRIKLAKRDSAGRTLHVHEAGEVEWGMVRHFEEELGVLSKNRIEAEYTLPYRVVWADVRERASYWGIIALLLGGCWYATFRYFRMERKNARMRDFYMSLYRHDLRTSISVISNRVYCLKKAEGEPLTEKDRKGLEAINIAAKQIGKGIEQLVTVQVCEGKLRRDFRDVDVNGLLREVVERERWYLGTDSAARIETNLRAERTTVRGNLEALESMFQNLIENALKYGGDEPEVRVSSENTGEGGIRVEVADKGEGIPKEELKRIFKRKYRGRQSRGKIAGTGMGLYMTRSIAKAHRGRVDAESEAGKGCRFAIVLPLKKEEK